VNGTAYNLPTEPAFYARVSHRCAGNSDDFLLSRWMAAKLGLTAQYLISQVPESEVLEAGKVELSMLGRELTNPDMTVFPEFIEVGTFVPMRSFETT
jgi:hypothetical protein